MGKVFNKICFVLVSLLLAHSAVFALENEFKNSLVKVELTKTSENAYSVNLYTQKKFSEPVKVIKKSDLNYYILLPETKNSSSLAAFNTSDIRNVTTNLYPYAGQDVNNGYTKININTTKPINFNVNVKNTSQKVVSAAAPVSEAAKIALNNKTTVQKEVKAPSVQKKNSDFQKDKKTTKPIAQPQKQILGSNKTTGIQKSIKEKVSTPKKQAIKKQQTVKKPVKKETKIEDTIKEEPIKTEVKESTNNVNSFEEEFVDNEKIEENTSSLDEIISNEDLKEIEKIASDSKKSQSVLLLSLKSKLLPLKTKISNKLTEYGLNLKDITLMGLAALFSFVIMLILLTKKTPQARLKCKSELADKLEKTSSLTPKTEEEERKNDGQYFVFDKNIKQTGFCDPATSAIKRNYELSSYEPDLKDNYKRPQVEAYSKSGSVSSKTDNEYDIIQKILKEDSFIEIAPGEFEAVSKVQTAKTKQIKKETEPVSSPIKKAEIKKEQVSQEPIVLSSVEIAPERGFMCVSYNDNISLMGYIFDDVFALYNFKQPKLENYEIRFRLSEKDDKGANFIVKVGGTKMLIRATKSSMNLEVVM